MHKLDILIYTKNSSNTPTYLSHTGFSQAAMSAQAWFFWGGGRERKRQAVRVDTWMCAVLFFIASSSRMCGDVRVNKCVFELCTCGCIRVYGCIRVGGVGQRWWQEMMTRWHTFSAAVFSHSSIEGSSVPPPASIMETKTNTWAKWKEQQRESQTQLPHDFSESNHITGWWRPIGCLIS